MHDTTKDPVCGMQVHPETAKGGSWLHEGTTFHFCTPCCREKFRAEPARYLGPPKPAPAAFAPAPALGTEYVCPMHPEIVRSGPDSCPICGMALELPARRASLALCAPLCALLVGLIACTRHDPPSKTSALNTSLTTSAPTSGGVASSGAAAHSASPTNSEPARQGPRPKPQSAEECRQTCNGEWSAHGLVGVVSCLCRTNDSGKDCRDKAECQGECLLDPVRREVVKPGPPALGYFVGKCSEFVTMFGCTRRIHAGAKGGGPVDLSEPPPEICLD